MTAPRTRKEELIYSQYRKTDDPAVCSFCAIKIGDDQFVEETSHFKVIKNRFPYSLWDGQSVEDHLMVTPKTHRDNLAGMSVKEKAEYVDLLEKYEAQGYNIYARAPSSKVKSVMHQHTHLIKNIGRQKRVVIFSKKPVFRLTVG